MRRFLLVLVFLTAIDFCLMFAYCRFLEFCAGYTDFFGKIRIFVRTCSFVLSSSFLAFCLIGFIIEETTAICVVKLRLFFWLVYRSLFRYLVCSYICLVML